MTKSGGVFKTATSSALDTSFPSITSIGPVSIGRLHETWDGAKSWSHVLERLVELLNKSNCSNLGNSRTPAHMVLVLTAPLVDAVQVTPQTKFPLDVHRYCELTAGRGRRLTCTEPQSAGSTKSISKWRPVRFVDGFALVKFARKQTERQITTAGLGSLNGAFSSTSILGCLGNDILPPKIELTTRTHGSKTILGNNELIDELFGINSGADQNASTQVPDARTIHPSEDEARQLLRVLFQWRDARPERDVILVGLCANPQTTIVEVESLPVVSQNTRGLPTPALATMLSSSSSSSYTPRPIVQLLIGDGNDGAPWLAQAANSTLLKPWITMWQRKRTLRGSVALYSDNIEQKTGIQVSITGHIADSSARARLLLGPLVGAVSTTTAVIVIEVDAPADVAVEATPIQIRIGGGEKNSDDVATTALHAWLRPSLSVKGNSAPCVVRVTASVPAGRPTALHLTGLRTGTQYRCAWIDSLLGTISPKTSFLGT